MKSGFTIFSFFNILYHCASFCKNDKRIFRENFDLGVLKMKGNEYISNVVKKIPK
ncbi:MAG: hypothetical protein CNLJKLNK_00087 [Holosporales bacterium]